jgi:L-alanine-DL-glutamate epimerase-like enolase superfamily enzyme
MTIAAVSITPCEQRMSDPSWRFASARIPKVFGWILGITDSAGITGNGYTEAMPPMSPPPAAVRSMLEELTADLPGRDEADVHALMDEFDKRLFGAPLVKSAVECALFDLRARALGIPLHGLFGGARRASVPQLRIVPLKSPNDMASYAGRLAEEGYRFFKVKASGEPALDLARVKAVRQAVGDGVRLMVDANQSYRPKEAIAAISRMAEHGVELIEQPTPRDDLIGLEQVARAVPVAVEADESAQSLAEILRLAQDRIVDSINLRIMDLGGISRVLAAVAICEAAGIGYRFGACFAPRLYQAQAVHIAVTLPRITFAHELAEFSHILDDPFDGLEIVDGELAPPPGLGCGVSLRGSVAR